jgi:hypothetical protein
MANFKFRIGDKVEYYDCFTGKWIKAEIHMLNPGSNEPYYISFSRWFDRDCYRWASVKNLKSVQTISFIIPSL